MNNGGEYFGRVDERFDAVETRLSAVEVRLGGVDAAMAGVRKAVRATQRAVQATQQAVRATQQAAGRLRADFRAFARQVAKVLIARRRRIDTLERRRATSGPAPVIVGFLQRPHPPPARARQCGPQHG